MGKPEQTEEKAKTSIKIDPQLWKEAKIEAIKHDIELSDLVERGLKSELQKLKKMTEVRP
jgi:predicted HicB family RNase H-like nuclease